MKFSHRKLIGAIWIAGGVITIGLSEVAHVLGRTGTRLYAYDGGYAFGLGSLLILAGLVLMAAGLVGKHPGDSREAGKIGHRPTPQHHA